MYRATGLASLPKNRSSRIGSWARTRREIYEKRRILK
jgi:hypothetical protein